MNDQPRGDGAGASGEAAETDRIRVSPERLKELWFLPQATRMIHDRQTNEKVVVMEDGTEYACTLDPDVAEARRAIQKADHFASPNGGQKA